MVLEPGHEVEHLAVTGVIPAPVAIGEGRRAVREQMPEVVSTGYRITRDGDHPGGEPLGQDEAVGVWFDPFDRSVGPGAGFGGPGGDHVRSCEHAGTSRGHQTPSQEGPSIHVGLRSVPDLDPRSGVLIEVNLDEVFGRRGRGGFSVEHRSLGLGQHLVDRRVDPHGGHKSVLDR